jgi:hypothetical protein
MVAGEITDLVEMDSLGRIEFQAKYLKNDSLENYVFVTQYKPNGEKIASWYRANDTMWVGKFTKYLQNDTVVVYDNGYRGIVPDTGKVFKKEVLIGYYVRNDNNDWQFVKK